MPYGPGVTAVNIPYMLHFVMPAEGVVLAFTEEVQPCECVYVCVCECRPILLIPNRLKNPFNIQEQN